MLLKYNFLTSYRSLIRKPGFALINIIGLAIGLAACMLILLYISDELSYDKFHSNSDRIYRVYNKSLIGNNPFEGSYTPSPLAETLLAEYPEIEQVSRLWNRPQRSMRAGESTFIEDKFFFADSSFFSLFDFELLEGDPKNVLKHPGTIVLSEKIAQKYFGNSSPIGKTITENNDNTYTITGIMRDAPSNSHVKPELIASFVSDPFHNNNNWFSQSPQTYILLREDADPQLLEDKIPAFVDKYIGPELIRILGISLEGFTKAGQSYGYKLQALEDIHLYSNIDGEYEANGNIQHVYIFSAIAIFILLIACINFMNLTTARAASRAKEVGIKKVLGGIRPQLIRQFIGESILLTAIAMVLALFIIELSLPAFNRLAEKNLSFLAFGIGQSALYIVAITVITGFIAGSYPAFFLSAYSPIKTIKRQFAKSGSQKNIKLRSALVLFQFTISITLLIATVIIFMQMDYIQQKKMGFDSEQLLVIKHANGLGSSYKTFKNKLLKNPAILNAAYAIDLPGEGYGSNAHLVKGRPAEEIYVMQLTYVDPDYLETMGMEMSWGRFFSAENPTDTAKVIINEQAVQSLGLTDMASERLILQTGTAEESSTHSILGVIKDFHFSSLHEKVQPIALYMLPEGGWANRLAVRIQAGKTREVIEFLEQSWNEMQTGHPFVYTFMDQTIAKLYQNDQKTRVIYTIFSILALFVASLGLFGLAAYTTESRTKEIGIRKVLGANERTIIFMLSRDFTKWVLFANVLAWPMAYILANQWLNNFAYRIDMPWHVFIIAGVSALLLALMTVLYQTLKAARKNPSKALKYE
jgi:putative ABC transport system permease protein